MSGILSMGALFWGGVISYGRLDNADLICMKFSMEKSIPKEYRYAPCNNAARPMIILITLPDVMFVNPAKVFPICTVV